MANKTTQYSLYPETIPITPTGATEERALSDIVANYLTMHDFGAIGDSVTDDSTALSTALSSGRHVDGLGKIYAVTDKPASFKNIINALFKVGTVYYPTKDFLRSDSAKITNSLMYTAWPQDKAYKVGTQLKVWVNEKEAHTDGTARIVCYISDDGGESFTYGEYLDARASGDTLWGAGWDGNTEYLFVRNGSGGIDTSPYSYTLYSRSVSESPTSDYNSPFSQSSITFPVPSGFSGQPVMIHSFTTGHAGSIVVGASYGEGAAVMRSTDGGLTFSETVLATGGQYEEPTVRYDAISGNYVGFMRNGTSGEDPFYWYSTDNLASVSVVQAPTGFFGGGGMSDSTVCFDIDENQTIHAVVAYRNGILEGDGTDDVASCFYLTGDIVAGNFWSQSSTKNYFLGSLRRREKGGASAIGQGAVICDGQKVHLYYGQEDRTGVTDGLGRGNRVSNIYQTIIFQDDFGGFYNTLTDTANDRTSSTQMRKIFGIDAFEIPFTDDSGARSMVISGRTNQMFWPETVVVSAGTITLNGKRAGSYIIDTEGNAASDTVSNISDVSASRGDIIHFQTLSSSRDITFEHGTGNILCGSNKTLPNAQSEIVFKRDSAGFWRFVSLSVNA